jgi:hypothetical protein
MEVIRGKLDSPVFTVNLKPAFENGTLEFGHIDRESYKGDLMTASINNMTDGSWTVDEVVMKVGDVEITQPMLFGTYA